MTGPGNVVAALVAVMADMPPLGKDQQASAAQGGYQYRGVEAVTAAAQKLLARHGVVILPAGERLIETRELIVNGKPWTDTVLEVTFAAYGPGGLDDRVQLGPFVAVGRDNSDKGPNKARTQAFKYCLLESLCVADSKSDGDGQTVEADGYVPDGSRRRRSVVVEVPAPAPNGRRNPCRELHGHLVCSLPAGHSGSHAFRKPPADPPASGKESATAKLTADLQASLDQAAS